MTSSLLHGQVSWMLPTVCVATTLQLQPLTHEPQLGVLVQVRSNVSHHTQDMAARHHSHVLRANVRGFHTDHVWWNRADRPNEKGRHSHLIMRSQASRILSNGILGDDGATMESSSQAPAACSASECEIRLVRKVGVNFFCLDQIVKALLKYRLRKKRLNQQRCLWVYRFLIKKWSSILKCRINLIFFNFPILKLIFWLCFRQKFVVVILSSIHTFFDL